MVKGRFLYDVYEEKYAIIPYYYSWGHIKDGNWHLGKEYHNVSFSAGYKMRNVMRYVRIKENNVLLHEEDMRIVLRPQDKVEINNEIVTIVDVIKKLDGSIDYYTDKEIFIPLNTIDTFFDERVDRYKK